MNCWKCGCPTEKRKVCLVITFKDGSIRKDSIEAEVCGNCNEKTYDANDIKELYGEDL